MKLRNVVHFFVIGVMSIFTFIAMSNDNLMAQKTYKLKVDTFWGPEYHATKNAVLPSLRAIEEKSNGRIKFDIYYAKSLAKPTEGYDATAMGITDIYWFTGPNYETGSMDRGAIFSLPFALPLGKENVQAASNIMYEVFQKHVEQEIVSGVEVLGWGPLSEYKFITVDKVKEMQDLRGMTVRSSGGYHDDIIKAVGGSPEYLGPGEIYEALERGILDGIFWTYAALYGYGSYDPVNYATSLGFTTFPFYTVMNKGTFEKLPKDLQKIVSETFKEYAPKAGISYYDAGKKHFPEMELEEIDFTEAEKQKIMKATIEPVWQEWIKRCKKKDIPYKEMIQDLAKAWQNQGLTPPKAWVKLGQ